MSTVVPTPDAPHGSRERSLATQTAARFTSNLAFRFIYPFLGPIARGAGTSIGTMGVILSIRDLVGLGAPVIGRAIDRGSQRWWMVGSLVAMGLMCLLASADFGIWSLAIALIAIGTGKNGFDTAMTAWLGDNIAYAGRGRITAMTELSWAGSLLIGAPLMGLLINARGWQAPFLVLGIANLAMAAAIAAAMHHDGSHRSHDRVSGRFAIGDHLVFLVAIGALTLGMQLVLITYSTWLEDDFGLSVTGLGRTAIVLGVGELIGTGLAIAVTDRIGKTASIVWGTIVMAPVFALFGATSSATVAIGLLAVGVLGFELSFISMLPLASELAVGARGAALGVVFGVATLFRALGSLVGPSIYESSGMGAVGLTATGCVLVTAVLIGRTDVEQRARA
ncbi:MAG: MFS transporter [Acidimicrobiia bacterium]|nr:MFS transporter [Acidimicrobiia bacterium]